MSRQISAIKSYPERPDTRYVGVRRKVDTNKVSVGSAPARQPQKVAVPSDQKSGRGTRVEDATTPPAAMDKMKSGFKREPRVMMTDFVAARNGGLSEMKERILGLKTYLSDPTKKASPRVVAFVKSAIAQYELAVKASLGMPTYSDSVVIQHEAPPDIPTAPLSGFQLLSRVCYIVKLATNGSTAGGFYANLTNTDFGSYVGDTKFFRIKRVTSWTGTRPVGNAAEGSFAGVQVPATQGGAGTEVMPMWSENWTPIGKGFAGIVTQYPLGDFPQTSTTDTSLVIISHFTALGGTGGVTGIPVIFHAEIECLI